MQSYIKKFTKTKGRQQLRFKIDANNIEEIQVIFKSKNLFATHTKR